MGGRDLVCCGKFALEISLGLISLSNMLLHMKTRSPVINRLYMSSKERAARSRLAKLVHDYQLLPGGLVTTAHCCGKPGCGCTKGTNTSRSTWPRGQSKSALTIGSKRKMMYVPKHLEQTVLAWVEVYRETAAQLFWVVRMRACALGGWTGSYL